MMREEETLEDKSCYEQRIENTFQTIPNRNTQKKKKKILRLQRNGTSVNKVTLHIIF